MRKILTMLFGFGLLAHEAFAAHLLWLETERFDRHGGWVSDAQFIDQMGSPYLLANGMGKPVQDAATRVVLPAAGKRRLWARTKDWAPEHHPGPFQILLDGRPVGRVFGRSGQAGWRWEDGGVCQLGGEVVVALHDLTGYYGRCDVVVLADDLQWIPPSDKEAIDELRRQWGGVSKDVETAAPRDVVVVGGGLAGCTAAVAAARNRASVVLIQNRPVLGGNASTEILVPPVGVSPGAFRAKHPLDPAETGLIEEYRTAGNQVVSEGKLYSKRLLRFVQLEPNLDLRLDTHAVGVELAPAPAKESRIKRMQPTSRDPLTLTLSPLRETPGREGTRSPNGLFPLNSEPLNTEHSPLRRLRGERGLDREFLGANQRETSRAGGAPAPGSERRIAAVLTVNVRTGQRIRFPGGIFIDCTGDAVIGAAAGAEYRHGKEPRSMYDEPWAPEAPTKHTMGNGLKYFAQDTGEPQPFDAPSWVFHFPACGGFGPGRHPRLPVSEEIGDQWVLELGGLRDTCADAEEIRDDLFRLIYGLWDHTKNHCPEYSRKGANYALAWVGHVAGKRENRRLIGDYVLTQNDIARQTLFPDRVAFGGWSVDDHYSAGFFHKGPTAKHVDDPDHVYIGLPFSIPYRCLYSKNVENLMMAGRDISASHLGLSDTRVMLTCAVIGHAAGVAAAMCIEHGTTPRGVYQQHIQRLQQQLLKEGAHIIDLQANDPRDLAPRAKIRASSETTHVSGERMAAGNVINGYAWAIGEKDRERTNAWGPDPAASGPHWIELAWPDQVALNMVHVSFRTARLSPKRFAIEARLDGGWKPIAEVAENRHRRHVLGLERVATAKLRVVEDEPAAICEIRVYDEPQRLVDIARRAHQNMRRPDVGPWLPWGPGPQTKKLPGIVLDASWAQPTGLWLHSTSLEPFLEDGYLHDGNEGKGTKSIRFEPGLPGPGRYEVRIAYAAYANRAANAPVTINAVGGPQTVRINQQKAPPIDGLFLSLGTFELDGKSSIVVSNADTDGYVVVDALQLLRVK